MTRWTLALGLGLAGSLLHPVQARGQSRATWGLELDVAQQTDVGLGLRFDGSLEALAPSARRWRFQGTFNYFFPDGALRYWELNGNLAYQIPTRAARVEPFAGAGLEIAHSSVAGVPYSGRSDLGANLLAGVKFLPPRGPTPFVELRFELGGGDQLVFSAGLLLF
jgi:hypothetical protein